MSGAMRSLEDLTEQQILAMLNPAEPRARAGNPGAEMLRQMYLPPPQEPISYDALRERLSQLRPMNVTNPPGATMPLGMQEPESTPQVLSTPQSPLTPTQQAIVGQPPAALPPLQEVTPRPQPPVSSVPMYQPPAAPPPAVALPAPVPAPASPTQAQQPQGGGFSFGSGNTLMGLAALADAFAIYGGRQPTSLAQIAPIAMRREATQSAIQEIDRRLRASNLTPEQRAIVGGAAQQAVSAAPAAQGEVPVLRAAPGQDPNEVRGVRTNNPLNLSFANQPNAIGTDGRFAVFQTPEEGVAASVRQLQLYGQRGLNTIDQIVSRWAPPSENNTPAYIQAVAQRVGVSPNQEIDLSDPNIMRRLVNAMSVQEVGRVIPEDVLQRGVELGYQPPQQRQQAQLTPEQRALAAPGATPPGVAAPGLTLRPRGVAMTPELASSLTTLAREDPAAALRMLTQLDLQASQQRGTRTLTATEAQAYFAAIGSPQLYDPNKAYEVKAEGGLGVVPGTRESEEPTPRQLREDAGKLRTEFGAQKPVQEFLQMGPQILAIRDGVSRENPSRINDISLTFAFAKMLDPTSVVRENEAGQIVASASVADRLAGYIARLNGNATFSPELRAQLLREAEGRYSSARTAYLGEVDAYTELARRKGVNPEFVIPPRRDLPEARPIPGSQQAQSNAVPEAQRPAVVAELTNRIQSGALTQQAARELARQLGIPNAERLFQ